MKHHVSSSYNNLSLALNILDQIRGYWFNFDFACEKQLGIYDSILRNKKNNNNNKMWVRDENDHLISNINWQHFSKKILPIFFSFILRQNAINKNDCSINVVAKSFKKIRYGVLYVWLNDINIWRFSTILTIYQCECFFNFPISICHWTFFLEQEIRVSVKLYQCHHINFL